MIDSLDVMLWGHKAGTLIATKSGYNTRNRIRHAKLQSLT